MIIEGTWLNNLFHEVRHVVHRGKAIVYRPMMQGSKAKLQEVDA